MGFMCDFCGEQRSMVYCQSDAASLCLSCDQNVHSANALSKRHSRTLVCERCNSQPAFVRCVEERASMCQNCDRREHAASTSTSTHRKQLINCYSGCPSGDELSTIWPFLLDNSASPMLDDSTCEQGMGLLTIAENSLNNNLEPTLETTGGLNPGAGNPDDNDRGLDKSDAWMGCSSTPELSAENKLDQLSGFGQAVSPKTPYPGAETTEFCEDDFFAQLDMDDFDTNFESCEELFNLTHTRAEQLENGGIDDFVMMKDPNADSGCLGTVGAEGSIGAPNALQPACSNAASGDSILSIRTEPPICFGAKQAHSGVSYTVESGGGDYQDCGVSSMRLLGESPWCPPESSPLSGSRTDAVLRYKEKKKSRKFEKKVRYASRKERADVRKRVKGRFIKAGDAYDYDPLSETRSF